MGQMKPRDLKEAAKLFTEKYYPQWSHRVDRIWEMFEKIDVNSSFAKSDHSQFQLGDAFGIAGMPDSVSQEAISGIAVFAFTYQNVKNDEDINAADIKKQISVVPMGIQVTPALQQKLENVLSEMFPSMINQNVGLQTIDNSKSTLNSDEEYLVVYLSRPSGYGSEKYFVRENEVHSRYLSDKQQYDIIIYNENVEIKSVFEKSDVETVSFEPVEMYANILSLLILFIKYKDEKLPFLSLYHCAFKGGAEYESDVRDANDIMDKLKAGVSTLRRYVKEIRNFNIPSAKRKDGSYICKGSFNFCLILKDITDQRYTLEEG